MGLNRRLQVFKYLVADFVTAAIAWTVLYRFRKEFIEQLDGLNKSDFTTDQNYLLGLLFVPLFWLLLYAISGMYKNIFRRYRLKELGQTMFASVLGVTILFFLLILDDEITSYKNYYQSYVVLLGAQFSLTFVFRYILTNNTVKKIHAKKIGFNTILVGGSDKAKSIYNEMDALKKGGGYQFLGFVSINGVDHVLSDSINHLGNYKKLPELVLSENVEEVIIAIESSEHEFIGQIINLLEGLKVNIKIIPDMYDILSGQVKMTSIFGTPLIEINKNILPAWQVVLKRAMDIIVSLIALIILLPLFMVLAILIQSTSKGGVFFKQQRIGLHQKPFTILKFRSMCVDAEKNGPQLSSTNDNRITGVGKIMRKTRMDELPQFFNVLIGEMSLVGPRPERQFFIDEIVKIAPHYHHLHKVKPGITSWGMVKYGYAENVEQMIERMKYDILYIENMTIGVDLKILGYTVLTVVKGSGK